MIRSICCSVLLLFSVLLSPLFAQEKPKDATEKTDTSPKLHLVVPSADRFVEDLRYILKMTSKPKQYNVMKDYIDEVFLIGVDFKQPLRLDILLDDETYRMRAFAPIATKKELKIFREDNIGGFLIKTRLMRNTNHLYKLRNNKRVTVGWLRWRDLYGIVAEQQKDVPPKINKQKVKLPHPLDDVKELLNKDYDVAIEGKNKPNGVKERHTQFLGTRKQMLAAIKRNELKKETEEDFAIRKMIFSHQLDELQRLYAEAEHLFVGWNTDAKAERGQLDLTLKPLPGTDLDKSLKILGLKPSYFANIPKTKAPILSGRINLELDDLRKKYLQETVEALRKRKKAQLDQVKETPAAQKIKQKKAWDMYFDMVKTALQNGLFNGFVEVNPTANKKHTMLGGIQSPNGTAVIPLLKLLGEIHADMKPELNVEAVGDVKIHKLQIVKSRHPGFIDMFGNETLYMGTSKKVVWYAAGENALKNMKAAIKLAAEPNKGKADAAILLDAQIKMFAWIELLDQRRSNQKDQTKGNTKMRQLALIAFENGQDDLSLQIKRVDDHIEGKLLALPGVLRFVGEMIADFSKENLDD